MRELASRTLPIALLLVVGLLAACSTDSPTAPQSVPPPPPGSGDPSATWNITVTADPKQLEEGSDQPSTITIRVRRADNGQAPPDGATIVVTASLGEFLSLGSGVNQVIAELFGGGTQLQFYSGSLTGTATIQAQLEQSIGQAAVEIVEKGVLFITRVSPTSGSDRGGTRIRIEGTAFKEPLLVWIGGRAGGLQASVDSVKPDGTLIRADTQKVPDPESFLNSEGCDSDGDGANDGVRLLPKTFAVEVELVGGVSTSLPNAFTYTPSSTSCVSTTPKPNKPKAAFTFTKNGFVVLFNNQSTPPSGLTFTWIFGDGSAQSSEVNPVHTYAAGVYDVTLRAVNSAGTSTVTKTITVP